MTEFSKKIIETILSIPPGKVMTYGQIALICGSPKGARQVSRILYSCSKKYNLPWHRVIGSNGKISLPLGGGREEQMDMLFQEGVKVGHSGLVDLNIYQAFS